MPCFWETSRQDGETFVKRHLVTLNALILAVLAIHLLVVPRPAQAQTESVLYSFCSQANCADGYQPYTGLIVDREGNLYGTTLWGGATGWGTVFEISSTGEETVLYSFCSQANCADGAEPSSGLIKDAQGRLYGTTEDGGSNNWGTVFELSAPIKSGAAWTEKVLYRFSNPEDGIGPIGGVIGDREGNLYGITAGGGTAGLGTIFKLTPSGEESVLYSFGSHPHDGYQSSGGLVMDKEDNLYGTTAYGGQFGDGIVFKVSTAGQETVVYNFCSQTECADGQWPFAGLLIDERGDLYGTTYLGGNTNSCTCCGCGTIFRITTTGKERVFQFTNTGGQEPQAPVIAHNGDLYGTTSIGGINGQGTVYKVSSTGIETVLYSFCSLQDCADGQGPIGPVTVDGNGNIYGTTPEGGAYRQGTVYKVTP
jgi:uncharacterized repeat protein (TIGR03803 family)